MEETVLLQLRKIMKAFEDQTGGLGNNAVE